MSHDTTQPTDEGRRRFVRTALRWTAALTLGGGLFALSQGADNACPQPCAACPEWAGCRKPSRDPQAQKADRR